MLKKIKKKIVLGSSGLIGCSFKEILKKNNQYVFFSKNRIRGFKTFNLDQNINNFPYKDIDTCFFFSSPRILKKNMKKDIFEKEFIWLKKIINNIKINKLVYLSSSSVYYEPNHPIGAVKRKCEKYILKNQKNFEHFQIWRPFNLVGKRYTNTNHFHNFLFKKMFIQKNYSYTFFGNPKDKRGYSSVNDFVKILHKFSKEKLSFTKNYGNKDLVTINQIIDLYNKYFFIRHKTNFLAKFKSNLVDVSKISDKKNSVFSKKKSINILRKYIKESLT